MGGLWSGRLNLEVPYEFDTGHTILDWISFGIALPFGLVLGALMLMPFWGGALLIYLALTGQL